MRILIDTNIIINLEDNKIIDIDFSKFYSTAISNKCEILYHKDCLKDIQKDSNLERREIIKSKFAKYSAIENPANLDPKFSVDIGEKNHNDRIDNTQLYQVHKGYVELMVTNDRGIKKKAAKLGLSKKVLTSIQASAFLDKLFTLKIPAHPVLTHMSVRALESDYKSDFFESLRADYGGQKFMSWIDKCAKEDRKCYALRTENKLEALLIYNFEDATSHGLKNIEETSLKICTLKVAPGALGIKLGELFLSKIFHLALVKNVNFVFITTYQKQNSLIELLLKFGFEKHSSFINNVDEIEFIFVKNLNRKNQSNQNGTKIHPYFRESVKKYIIPIQPRFYTSLFKDGNLRDPSLFDFEDYGLQEVQGNTIIKAYISNSTRTDLVAGDMLFFYSSHRHKKIEPLGILIEHTRISKLDELWEKVKSKTVYTRSFLEKELEERKYLTVTIFRFVQYLNPPVDFKTIKQFDSFKNKFQTITELKELDYQRIKENNLDESFIIN